MTKGLAHTASHERFHGEAFPGRHHPASLPECFHPASAALAPHGFRGLAPRLATP
jgi:hypothetical protein